MSLNRDGLEPGQIVDYETMRKVEAERKRRVEQEEKPRRGRKLKQDEADE